MEISNPLESQSTKFTALTCLVYGLSYLIVPLRIFCRAKTKAGLWWDDWFILAALFFNSVLFILSITVLRRFLGRHITNIDIFKIDDFGKAFVTCEIAYVIVLALIKTSILAFYWRLFAVASRLPIIVMEVVIMAWAVCMTLVLIFQCHPVEDGWLLLAPDRKCIDLKKLLLSAAVPNIVTDAIMMAMPVPYILRLNMRFSQKIAVAGVFLVGGFDMIVAIIRIVVIMQLDLSSPDFTWYLNDATIWTSVEINVAIICACLPSLRPVLNFLRTGGFFSHSESSVNPSSTHQRQPLQLNSSRWRPFGKENGTSETDGTISLVNMNPEFENAQLEHGRFDGTNSKHIEVRKDWSIQYDHAL